MSADVIKCPNCGQSKIAYKRDLKEAQVLMVRQDNVYIIQESAEFRDEKEKLGTLLDDFSSKVEDTQVKEGVETLKRHLALPSMKDIQIGDTEPIPTVQGKCSLGAMLDNLNTFRGCSSVFLPLNCTFYQRLPAIRSDVTTHLIIMSRPPKEIDVLYRGSNMSETKTYRISVPFMHLLTVIKEDSKGQWAIDTNNSFLFLTKNQLDAPTDEIFRFPMNNQHNDGRFCWGTVKVNLEGVSWRRYVSMLFNLIFQSTWNDDLRGHGNEIPVEIGNLDRWAEMTVQNPYFAIQDKISWRPHANDQKTVQQLIERVQRSMTSGN